MTYSIIDIYEFLACFIICCGDHYKSKIELVFGLFDFDESGYLDQNELILTLQASIRGLCKLANLPIPPHK